MPDIIRTIKCTYPIRNIMLNISDVNQIFVNITDNLNGKKERSIADLNHGKFSNNEEFEYVKNSLHNNQFKITVKVTWVDGSIVQGTDVNVIDDKIVQNPIKSIFMPNVTSFEVAGSR